MAEQVGDRLAIVGSSDGFCQDYGDVNHLYFGAVFHLLLLRYGIGDYSSKHALLMREMAGPEKIP